MSEGRSTEYDGVEEDRRENPATPTVYQMAFGYDADISEIDDKIYDDVDGDVDLQSVTLEDVVRSADGRTITWVCIEGTIPPDLREITPQLRYLRLRGISSDDQLLSVCQLSKLEVLDISWNRLLDTLPDRIGELSSLRELNVSNCNLSTIPPSICQLHKLEKLNISHNKRLETLPDKLGEMSCLRELDARRCNLSTIPPSVCQLSKLEVLYISGNRQLKTLPDKLGEMSSLRELDVYSCNLSTIPPSICQLSKLEKLNISYNYCVKTLPDKLGELSSLTELNVAMCGISTIPVSICQLSKLEELDISGNHQLETLPDNIGELSSLRKLNVSGFNLSTIPVSICRLSKLEKLDISYNYHYTLPDELGELSSLRELNASSCNLSIIPVSICQLSKLEELDISLNERLETLPDWIGELSSLRRLDIGSCNLSTIPPSLGTLTRLEALNVQKNHRLKSIPHEVFKIQTLREVNCDECESLTSPPYAVCKQGLKAVHQYLADLQKDSGTNQRTFLAIVIGKSKAGKSSLVKSLSENKRKLTIRQSGSDNDQATKVFEVSEVRLDDHSCTVFFDCGGHSIYHVAYQLTFRSKCVPLLVIDIADYDKLAGLHGAEIACKEVCMDWIAHLYLSSPTLSHPLVVLTHADRLNPETLNRRIDELINTTEKLRIRIIEEETNMSSASSGFFSMISFCDLSKPLIDPSKVHVFSKDTGISEITLLKNELRRLGSSLVTEVPGSWYAMVKYVCGSGQAGKKFVELSDLKQTFPQDTNHYILQYVHELGRAMWFRERPLLHHIVFHRAAILTDMIAVLFNHASESMWESRIASFVPFKYDGLPIKKQKFKEMVGHYRSSGIMDKALLLALLTKESKLPPDVSIDILKAFHLICGPVKDQYVIPYFCKDSITATDREGCLQLRTDVVLNGLPIPVYSYSVVTAAYVDLNITALNAVQVGNNGARVADEHTNNYLLHDPTKSSFTILTSTPSNNIAESWRSQLTNLHKLLLELKSVWKGVRYEVVFYCSHCLMAGSHNPTTKVDPEWFNENQSLIQELERKQDDRFRSDKTFICRNNGQETSVPCPLMYPCLNIDGVGSARLDRCIQEYSSNRCTPTPVSEPVSETAGGVQSERRYIDEIVDMISTCPPHIDMEPEPVQRVTDNNDQTEYEVKEPRGRALIISNHYNNTREGSEQDYNNIRCMLQKFGFVTSGGHGNYSAKDIVDTIHRETQLLTHTGGSVHAGLSTFVLVITSHGDDGSVIGSDGVHVKLTDICDMLSPKNFPSMRGKPKMIIIQACSGVRREMLSADTPLSGQQITPDYLPSSSDNIQSDDPISTQDISVSDLLIMQASFNSFLSFRDSVQGSFFIRALVLVYYKLAHKYDVEKLAKIVQQCVTKFSLRRTEDALHTRTSDESYVTQVPKTVCTFINMKKLYLRPDARTTGHPQSVTDPVDPQRTTTRIDHVIRDVEEKEDGIVVKSSQYYIFNVRPNTLPNI